MYRRLSVSVNPFHARHVREKPIGKHYNAGSKHISCKTTAAVCSWLLIRDAHLKHMACRPQNRDIPWAGRGGVAHGGGVGEVDRNWAGHHRAAGDGGGSAAALRNNRPSFLRSVRGQSLRHCFGSTSNRNLMQTEWRTTVDDQLTREQFITGTDTNLLLYYLFMEGISRNPMMKRQSKSKWMQH